jgi:hypothetical protein
MSLFIHFTTPSVKPIYPASITESRRSGPFNSDGAIRPLLHVSRHVSRLRRVCSSRMMVMKKYGEAISQERIIRDSSLKKSFLHITR